MSDEIYNANEGGANSAGTLYIEDQVINEYVTEEVLAIDGVSRLVGGVAESFSKNFLGRETGSSSIKITRDDNNVEININIIVFYGVNIPQLSYDIQTSVKSAVEEFTGLTVTAVNIEVEGIDRK